MDHLQELQQQVADLKKQIDEMDRRIHQSDIPPGTIKIRHIDPTEGSEGQTLKIVNGKVSWA